MGNWGGFWLEVPKFDVSKQFWQGGLLLGSNWDKRLVRGGNNGLITFSVVFELGGLFDISVEGHFTGGIIYFQHTEGGFW